MKRQPDAAAVAGRGLTARIRVTGLDDGLRVDLDLDARAATTAWRDNIPGELGRIPHGRETGL